MSKQDAETGPKRHHSFVSYEICDPSSKLRTHICILDVPKNDTFKNFAFSKRMILVNKALELVLCNRHCSSIIKIDTSIGSHNVKMAILGSVSENCLQLLDRNDSIFISIFELRVTSSHD